MTAVTNPLPKRLADDVNLLNGLRQAGQQEAKPLQRD